MSPYVVQMCNSGLRNWDIGSADISVSVVSPLSVFLPIFGAVCNKADSPLVLLYVLFLL